MSLLIRLLTFSCNRPLYCSIQ